MSKPWANSQAKKKPCGTHAAWSRHQRRGEVPCEPCKDARNAYQRSLRSGYSGTQRIARQAALDELAVRFPEEFRTLYVAALKDLLAEQPESVAS